MKDFFKNELAVGDTVAFNPPYYKGLIKGTVKKFTPQKVTLEYKWQNRIETTNSFPQDVVKEPKPIFITETVVHDPYDRTIGGPNDYAYQC